MARFKNKTVIISGGASGFGEAMVHRFIEEKANVLLADKNTELGQKVADKYPGQCLFVQCDHCNDDDVQAVVNKALEAWGGIDILINNAGIGWTGDFISSTDGDWDRLLSVNLDGYRRMTQAVYPSLEASAAKNEQEGAVLIFVSSGLGLYGVANSAPYTVSKHGVIGLMRALAAEFGPKNIRVNAVCPGIADTPLGRATEAWGDPDDILEKLRMMTPLRRLAEPVDIANAAMFLASDAGKSVHGVALRVDGGAHT